jgi:hypothetical protein
MGDSEFKWVRSIFGRGPDATKQYNFIPDGGINALIKEWHEHQIDRDLSYASPSKIMACPRVIWLMNHGVEPTNIQGWGQKQRMLLGRNFENKIAEQLEYMDVLLYHWKDDPGEVDKSFEMGKDLTFIKGTPDLLLKLDGKVCISDAKTSRSDSFGYLPIGEDIWQDDGWKRYRTQLNAYFALCHANKDWFKANNLPLPEYCHLFSFALDDGIVRREYTWKPTETELNDVVKYTIRFNEALVATKCPDCTCNEWDMKFCPFSIMEKGGKVGTSCCDNSLISKGE